MPSTTEYEEFVGFHRPFHQTFPDYHAEVKEMIAEGDLVVTWTKVDATRCAEFEYGGLKDIPATGKHAAWDEILVELPALVERILLWVPSVALAEICRAAFSAVVPAAKVLADFGIVLALSLPLYTLVIWKIRRSDR